MSLDTVKQEIKAKVQTAPHVEGRFKFDFGEEGRIFIDNTVSPPEMSEEDKEADVALMLSLDTFKGILDGSQDPSIAFMMGKLKVKGSMGLAMKLNSILED